MQIIGGIEDNINMLVWSQITDGFFKITGDSGLNQWGVYQNIFSAYTHPWLSNQPISMAVASVFLTAFGLHGYNALIFLTVLLNFYFSYRFFKKYSFGLFYSIIFSFSTYFWIHLGHHIELTQIWLIPFVFESVVALKTAQELKKCFVLAAKLLFAVLISNYLGFGLVLSVFVLLFVRLLTKQFSLKLFAVSLGATVLFLVISLFPYLKTNYLAAALSSQSQGYLSRPLEDFFYFSSRTWYFVVPFPKNIIFGEYGSKIYTALGQTGHYLADDYFQYEHAANYFGLALFIIGCIVILKMSKRKYLAEIVSILSLLLIMLPPYFTILGIKIFTPNYLIYSFFPMFRTTTRFSVFILFILLYLIAENVSLTRRIYKFIFGTLLVFTFVDTYVPIKTAQYPIKSDFYEKVQVLTPEKSIFVIYPESGAHEALLSVPIHKRFLLNSKDYMYKDFNSKTIFESMPEPQAKPLLQENKVEYVVLKDVDEKSAAVINNLNLVLITSMEGKSLYKVNY